MRAVTSTKQRSSLISWQVYASLLITIFFFAPNPRVISMAQSEGANGKEPSHTQTPHGSSSLYPKITYRESAKYTEEARDNIAHGTVALSVVFRVGGNITDIKVLSGLPYGLIESAIEAATKVRFEPGMKDGKPVSVRGRLEFNFVLHSLGEGSIRKMLRNDFPVLSQEIVKVMATEIYKRGDNDTQKAWQYGQQRLENGVIRLPQSEREELMSLTLEAIQGLDVSDQQIYQSLSEKSKIERLADYEQMKMNEFRFRGIARLSDEKRRRAEALYNKAASF